MRVRENNSMASRYSSSATSPSASCARASAAAPQQRMPKPHARSDVQQPGVDRHPLPLAEDPADIPWRLVLGRSPIRLRCVYGQPRARNR